MHCFLLVSLSLSLSLFVFIYLHIYVYVHTYMCMYIYVYVYLLLLLQGVRGREIPLGRSPSPARVGSSVQPPRLFEGQVGNKLKVPRIKSGLGG